MSRGTRLVALLSAIVVAGCASPSDPSEEQPLPPIPADEAVTQRIAAVLRAQGNEEAIRALQIEISRLLANTPAQQDAEQVVRSSLLAAVETSSDIDALFALQRQAAGGVFSTRFTQIGRGLNPLALCEDTEADTVVYFVNGIMTTLPEALTSLHLLEAATHITLAGTGSVDYRLFYNPTNIPGGDDPMAWCQSFGFLAVYGQVSEEEKSRLRGLAESRCGERGRLSDLFEVAAQYVSGTHSVLEEDWLTERLQDVVRSDVLSGKRVIIVAHSQGNIYARNMAHRFLAQQSPFEGDLGPAIGVVSLGSPVSFSSEVTSFLGGLTTVQVEHELISLLPGAPEGNVANELSVAIENALASAAASSAWVALKFLLTDRVDYVELALALKKLGIAGIHSYHAHLLSPSYFAAPVFDTVGMTMAEIASRLRNPREQTGQGFLQVALTWDRPGDIDLYVQEPGGKIVYYIDRVGQDGELDRDDTSGTGPENYYICSPDKVSEGRYRISVNNYNGELGTQARITVRAGSKFAHFIQIVDEPNQGSHLIPLSTIDFDGGSFSILRAQ
ncbi:MAG: hypothetical protein R3B48_03305 [Kofleriaceae bacterium]